LIKLLDYCKVLVRKNVWFFLAIHSSLCLHFKLGLHPKLSLADARKKSALRKRLTELKKHCGSTAV